VRKIVVAVLSAIVVGLMLVPSGVSAGSNTVSFTDRQGDLGKPWYSAAQGSHTAGDPLSWWSGNSPISNAGYLDLRSGWVTVKGNTVTMGLTVDSPLTKDSKLPQGITEVRWAWYFYLSIDVTYGGYYAPYSVYILWDGADFSAALVDHTSGSPPFVVTQLDNFIVDGSVLSVTMSLASIPGVVAWYSQSLVMYGSPWSLDQMPSAGGWNGPDITDFQGPLAVYWPWQAMP